MSSPTESDALQLSDEDQQSLQARLTMGGFGVPPEVARTCRQALRVVMNITFSASEIRNLFRSQAGRRRSAALIEYQKRQTLKKLYRALAWAAIEPLSPSPPVDRNVRRRKLRALRGVFRQRRAPVPGDLRRIYQQLAFESDKAHAKERRRDSKEAKDVFHHSIRQLLKDHTTLRGGPLLRKVTDIAVAVGVSGSREMSAVQRRFERSRLQDPPRKKSRR
jgi:hypothetical protein